MCGFVISDAGERAPIYSYSIYWVMCVPFDMNGQLGVFHVLRVYVSARARACVCVWISITLFLLIGFCTQGNQRIKFNWSDRARRKNTKIVNDFYFDNRFDTYGLNRSQWVVEQQLSTSSVVVHCSKDHSDSQTAPESIDKF